MAHDTTEITELKDGKLVVKAVELTGTILSKASTREITTIVNTSKGKELAVKVTGIGGGGGGGGSTAWGDITGTLSNQTDLQTELEKKLSNTATGTDSIAIGYNAEAQGNYALAIGANARASANGAVQLLEGANTTANTIQIKDSQFYNLSTGKVVMARLPIEALTQAAYDAKVSGGTIDANTLYLIIPAS